MSRRTSQMCAPSRPGCGRSSAADDAVRERGSGGGGYVAAMPRLRQVSRDEATAPIVGAMYDFVFGPDRDPVAEPGTATGTPGDWWTTFALVPDVRAVLAYTDALVLEGGRVPDGVFAALREHLTDEQILELTYITCLYEMHATMSRALRTEWDDRDEPVVEVPGEHTSLAPEVGVEPGRTAAPNP